MRFTVPALAVVLTALQPALAAPAPMSLDDLPHWGVEFYESGCPTDGTTPTGDQGSVHGAPNEESVCYPVGNAHNVKLTAVQYDNMKVILYSYWDCAAGTEIATITKDGCSVIPEDTVIAAASVVNV